ncbi:MAG: hypothetical protein HC923_00520 [Myxococcales bacterium]|nr:hypothetical protein [Myxococcales bacterium]
MTPAWFVQEAFSSVLAAPFEEVPLSTGGPMCRAAATFGLRSLPDLARFLFELPYGRVSGREPHAPLIERKGTCSSKTRVLWWASRELGVDVEPIEGLVWLEPPEDAAELRDDLDALGLDGVPELHVYVRYGGRRFDLTDATRVRPAWTLSRERRLEDDDFATKAARHRRTIDELGLDSSLVWSLRERCIASSRTRWNRAWRSSRLK